MAVTGAWITRTGASAGTLGAVSSPVVFGGSDDGAANAAADPITAGNNSIKRFFVIRFTETTTSTATLDNIRIDRSDSNGSVADIDGNGTNIDAKQGETYGENVTTNITAVSTALQASGANNITLTASAPGGSTSDSQQFAVQVDTTTTATAGVSFTLRCQFDITV